MLLAACLYTPHSARNQRAVITNSPSSSSSRSSRHTHNKEREGGQHHRHHLSLCMARFFIQRDPLPVTLVRVVTVRVAFTHTHTLGHDRQKKKNRQGMPLLHTWVPPHTHTQGSAVPVAPILYMYVYTRCKNKTTKK